MQMLSTSWIGCVTATFDPRRRNKNKRTKRAFCCCSLDGSTKQNCFSTTGVKISLKKIYFFKKKRVRRRMDSGHHQIRVSAAISNPSQEESPPARIHIRLGRVCTKSSAHVRRRPHAVVGGGRDMVSKSAAGGRAGQRQYLVNPLVLPAPRVEGPMLLQGEQLEGEARPTFACHHHHQFEAYCYR
jgi:hypothetical protein